MTRRSAGHALAAVLAGAALVPSAAAAQGTDLTLPDGRVRSVLVRPGEEVDRVEIGAAWVPGFFDVVGSVGYRRLVWAQGDWEHSLTGELSGTVKDHLSEGVLSAQYLFRPARSYRPEWRLRPVLEAGPGLHLAVQGASIEGFGRTSVHARLFLKSHLYFGVEALLTRKLGLLLRGRITAPSRHSLDYAQAAILLR